MRLAGSVTRQVALLLMGEIDMPQSVADRLPSRHSRVIRSPYAKKKARKMLAERLRAPARAMFRVVLGLDSHSAGTARSRI